MSPQVNLPAPVVIWLDPGHPEFGTTLVATVRDAIDALHRHRLDDALQGPHAVLWRRAAAALVQADLDPTAENLGRAFDAMLLLVKRVAPVPTRLRILSAPRGLRERVASLFAPPDYGVGFLGGSPHGTPSC